MRYRAEIDGLRAVAVIPVILFHAGFSIFSGGYVGVDVFFVISGYLITTVLFDELEAGKFSILNFYERRARRILPALFLVMGVSSLLSWFWLMPSDMKNFSQSLVAVSLFSSNILFWHESGYFDSAAELKPLLHTWSLAVEEQYYLLFPVFLMLTWRLGRRATLLVISVVAITSLGLAEWGSLAKPSATFYLLPTRGWELLFGAFVASACSRKYTWTINANISQVGSVAGAGLLAYAIFSFNKATPFPSFYTLMPAVGTALILLFASQETFAGKLLSNKLFVGIGLVSYSAYLWHYPLFSLTRHRSLEEPSQVVFVYLIVLSFVLAYLSWKYVEMPFRNNRNILGKRFAAYSVSVSLLFISFGLAGHLTNGFEGRLPEEIIAILNPASSLTEQGGGCHRRGSRYADLDSSCVLGNKDHVIAALIGDSHANALSYELGIEANKRELGLLQLTYNGCPSIAAVYREEMGADDKCSEFNGEVFKYLTSNPRIEYVVMASRWTQYINSSGFDNGEGGLDLTTVLIDSIGDGTLERNVEHVRVAKLKKKYMDSVISYLAAGKKVILVYPIPEVGWSAPKHLARQKWNRVTELERSTSYDVFLLRNKGALDTLDAIGVHENLTRVYPHKFLCNRYLIGRCIFELDGHPLYYDSNHLSNDGAKLFIGAIFRGM